MKGTDKLLIWIVAGVVVLIAAAFAVTLTRPEPTYQEESSADGVAYNYLLALQKKDYERAYRYLSPNLAGRPETLLDFELDIRDYEWNFRQGMENSLAIQSSSISGNLTVVAVQETTFFGGGIFNSSQQVNRFEMDLRMVEGEWVIDDADYYFAYCWRDKDGCSRR